MHDAIAVPSVLKGSPMHPARPAARCLLLALGLTTALAGCDGEEDAPAPAEIRPVRAIVAEVSAGGRNLALGGTVESQIEVALAFRIGGRIAERPVNVGDSLADGQLVARLDPTDEENGLRAAEANFAAAEGQLVEARINFERQRQLYERQIAARAALDRAEQGLTSAQAAADAAEAQLGIARRRLADTELRADAPGVVVAVGAEIGEVVQAGRMIVQKAQVSGLDAVFDVAAEVLEASPPDPPVTVRLTLTPGVTAEGRVREVSPRADPATGTFRVRVGLIDPPPTMRLGSAVTGLVSFGGTSGIVLPASALTAADGEPAVWIVDPDAMTVGLRPIEVASFEPGSVTVAGGLEPGMLVVTAGVQALRPGQEVRLLLAAPASASEDRP
jgi:membrane fusion protein, multidrug efflux system